MIQLIVTKYEVLQIIYFWKVIKEQLNVVLLFIYTLYFIVTNINLMAERIVIIAIQ